MLTELPEKTEASLGQVKQDNVPAGVTLDPRYWTTAEQLEAIKSALIAACTDIGIDVSPASGSIKDRLDALDGGTSATRLVERVTTTNATPTEILRVTPTQDRGGILTFRGACTLAATATATQRAEFGFVTAAGAVGLRPAIADDSNTPAELTGVQFDVVEDGADIVVNVTGIAATEIKWVVAIEILYSGA